MYHGDVCNASCSKETHPLCEDHVHVATILAFVEPYETERCCSYS